MRFGLDIGGTKVLAVALDDAGEVAGTVRRPTGWGFDEVVASAVDAVRSLETEVGARATTVGIGLPGIVEPGTGRVRHAVNLGLGDTDVGGALAARLGVRVVLENDVNAAAIGAAALTRAIVPTGYLNVGTGVAAGVVTVDHGIWRGARGGAGEIGHMSIDPNGPACRCGQTGCIEAFAGGGAVAERWGADAALPILDLFDAADAGDERARELRAGIARGVAGAVRALVLMIDVDSVLLGGGLIALGDRLLDDVRAQLRRESAHSAFLTSLELDTRVRLLPLGSPAGAIGAALLGADSSIENKESTRG